MLQHRFMQMRAYRGRHRSMHTLEGCSSHALMEQKATPHNATPFSIYNFLFAFSRNSAIFCTTKHGHRVPSHGAIRWPITLHLAGHQR